MEPTRSMPTPAKRLSEPTSRTGPRGPWRRAARWLGAGAGAAILVLTVLLLYGRVVGIPDWITRRLVQRLGQAGVRVEIESAYVSVVRGLVLQGFRFYDRPSASEPVMEAPRVDVGFDVLEWFSKRHGVVNFRMRGARARLSLSEKDKPTRKTIVAMDRLDMAVQRRPGGFDVLHYDAEMLGIRFRGAGTVRRQPSAPAPDPSAPSLLDRMPAWVLKAIEQAGALHYQKPPQARLHFYVVTDAPELTRMALDVQGRLTQTPVGAFDRWSLEAGLEPHRLVLKSAVLRRGASRLSFSGSLSLPERIAEFRLFSDLPLRHWPAIIPQAWRMRLEEAGYEFQDKVSFELWGGPAPLADVKNHLGGWLSVERARCGGVWLTELFIAGRREQKRITLERVDGFVGKGPQQGPFKASGNIDLETGDYHGVLKGAFHPHLWKPLLPASSTNILNWFAFKQAPPSGEIDFSGCLKDLRKFGLKGSLAASGMEYRGVPLASCDTTLELRDGILTLDPLKIVREEGSAAGRLEVDYKRRIVTFQADSTASPHAIARMIGPGCGDFLESYRFEGPTHITASGHIGYVRWTPLDIKAWVEGSRIGVGWMLSDTASFRVRALDERLEFTDIDANLYGGRLTGRMAFYPLSNPRQLRYDAVGQCRDIRFEKLIANMAGVEGALYQGSLSGNFKVEGMAGKGRGRTAKGEGWIKIEEGQLFQIPLMGELSRWLTRLYPGLGFATQTDFKTDYVLRKGRFHTDEAVLQGSVLSLKARGDYRLNNRLTMIVQVQLLRDGLVAEAVRFATSPLTKLLEFKLTGSVSEPKWRPVNLPKEMFLIFD